MKLMGTTEIARRYGVSRQLVFRWQQGSNFPKPVAQLACGQIWREGDINRWQTKFRPDLREQEAATA